MAPKTPWVLKMVVDKLDLNIPTVLLMAKGAIAPTIGLAIYQSDKVAYHFSTLGYIIPIMSILTVPILPRARFIQNFVVTCLLVCLAAAISLLAMWIAVRARANTTHISEDSTSNGPVPGTQVSAYNAAASANLAVWLFFNQWLANTFRAYRPQYFLPSIIFSIFIDITTTYGTQFATMAEAESLVQRLLETFFAGFGLTAAVSLLIIPFTCRDLASMRITEGLLGFKTVLEAQGQFMLSLPARDWYHTKAGSKDSSGRSSDFRDPLERVTPWPEADALKKATTHVTNVQVKIQSELRFAKREVAWGKLRAVDFDTLCVLLKKILLPVLGMESLTQVTDRIQKHGAWGDVRPAENGNALTDSELSVSETEEKERWHWIFEQLNEPVHQLHQAMIEGIDYSLYTLELSKRPTSPTKVDLEANNSNSSPEQRGIAGKLENMLSEFGKLREGPLKEWCALHGVNGKGQNKYPLHERHHYQLCVLLNLQYSFIQAAEGVLGLVKFADSKVEDGTMKKNTLILPSWKQLRKWVWAALSREDGNLDYEAYSTRSGTVTVYLKDALYAEKDAEHLPPTNFWEKTTDKLRVIPHFLGSQESAFGFRVATGTMAIAIVCFLRNSQHFFIEQRLIWASIMVGISMTQTSGSGIYGQFLRFSGTAVAMVASYIVWYIVDQHTAGVIVFVGIAMFLYHYLLIRFPDNPVVPMIGMVTITLIVGYELQVQKVGLAISVSNGQNYHPLYELAPYRLAAVSGGVAVACFFTYFPSVVSARTQLRNDLGSSIYLLSNYCNSVHQTLSLWTRGEGGNSSDKKSPRYRLEKARTRIFAKELILLQGMRQHCAFTAWEPTFGGKFPRESYDRLINHTQNIIRFTTLIANVMDTFEDSSIREDTQKTTDSWLRDFKKLMASVELPIGHVTSTLSIIASSISTGRPLPPHISAPESPHLGQILGKLDAEIISEKHVCEPGYEAFTVMHVALAMLVDDLRGLLRETKRLVGEVNFHRGAVVIEDSEVKVDLIQVSVKQD